MAKKVGKHSAAANDFLEPKPVIITSVTDIGTERVLNNGAINIVYSLPAGSPEATLYTITPSPSVAGSPWTTSSTSYLAQGLASDQLYTFSIVASNGAGAAAATVTSAVRSTTKPSAPTSASVASAHPVANQDTVTWSPPTFTGGKPISSYTVVSSDGPSYPNSVSPKAIAETGGTTQSYTIYAVNPNGSSPGTVVGPITTFTPPHFPPFFPPYFPPFFPPFFPPHFPPFFPPHFPPFFPPFFPPHFPPFFPPHFPPFFPPYFATPTLPAVPTGLAASNDGSNTSLTWNAATGATSYEIFYWSGSTYTGTARDFFGITGTSYSHATTSLWYYFVRSRNAAGVSAYSPGVLATSTFTPPYFPGPPGGY
jgi:hypothetical protein